MAMVVNFYITDVLYYNVSALFAFFMLSYLPIPNIIDTNITANIAYAYNTYGVTWVAVRGIALSLAKLIV